MARKGIPEEVRKQADDIVMNFNKNVVKNRLAYYHTRYQGRFLYLGHLHYGGRSWWPICRLEYTGDMNHWKFAIYKYSDETYDPSEWMFPGAGHVDGTIEGAMKAGLAAYPP